MLEPFAHLGRYELQARLGMGGMGEVWRALDPHLQRQVAIKAIRPRVLADASASKRFAIEARAMAAVADPHVVRIYDCAPRPQQPWLVMELIDGVTLREVIRVGHRLTLGEWQRCAREICAGLAAIHHAGLVHRDVKPENIMRRQRCGSCVLLDLGLAHDGEQTAITEAGSVMGTIRYLSPERINGGDLHASSDCWALGISLLELAQGQVLYKGLEAPVIAHHIVTRGAPDLATVRDDIPPAWLAWWRDLVHPDPRQRLSDGMVALARLNSIDQPRALTGGSAETALLPTQPVTMSAGEGVSQTNASTSSVARTRTLRPQQHPPPVATLPQRKKGRFVYKLVLALWLLSTLAALITAVGLSQAAIADQKERLRQMVASAASSAALGIDTDAHQALIARGAAAVDDEGFVQIAEFLKTFRQQWPRVRYIYTMTRLAETDETGVVAFVVDASEEIDRNNNGVIDPEEMVAAPGTRYPASTMPRLLAGFTEAGADDAPITDQWGTWLSGYAPIRAADGSPSGSLVGIDVPIEHLNAMRRDFVIQAAVLVGSSLLAFIAAGWLLAHRLRRPVVALHQGMMALANGDLQARVSITTGDEFEDLANAFESLRQSLAAGHALRSAYERQVAQSLSGAQGPLTDDDDEGIWLLLRPQVHESESARDGALELQIATIHDHGAVIEGLSGGVIRARFRPAHPQDRPIQRALLCALALRDGSTPWPAPRGVSIARGQRAADLGAWEGDHFHLADILLDEATYHLVADRVVVDRLELQSGARAYALKAIL